MHVLGFGSVRWADVATAELFDELLGPRAVQLVSVEQRELVVVPVDSQELVEDVAAREGGGWARGGRKEGWHDESRPEVRRTEAVGGGGGGDGGDGQGERPGTPESGVDGGDTYGPASEGGGGGRPASPINGHLPTFSYPPTFSHPSTPSHPPPAHTNTQAASAPAAMSSESIQLSSESIQLSSESMQLSSSPPASSPDIVTTATLCVALPVPPPPDLNHPGFASAFLPPSDLTAEITTDLAVELRSSSPKPPSDLAAVLVTETAELITDLHVAPPYESNRSTHAARSLHDCDMIVA